MYQTGVELMLIC